jgi:Tfp pilus assembly protein PilO
MDIHSTWRRYGWLLTIASGAYVAMVFVPTAHRIRQLRAEARAQTDFIAQADTWLAALKHTEEQLEAAEAYVRRWGPPLAGPHELPWVLAEVSSQVGASGATLARIEPRPPLAVDALGRLPIELTTEGAFAELTRLLVGLESLRSRPWLEEVAFTAPREDGGSAMCALKLIVFAGQLGKTD